MALVNEQIVLEAYLEQIKNDNVNFLKGKDEFKSNISEEISLLIKEENMNNRIEIAKRLWKLLFEAAMSSIDPDKRGYDNIFSYFDEYVNFEELIFASDSFYRDHTMHCLWVYFLGEYIKKVDDYKDILINPYKKAQEQFFSIADLFKKSKHSELFKDFIYMSDNYNNLVDSLEAIWCISSLTHDLGYPIKKIGKINKCIQKILPYFAINNYDEFDFKYTDIQLNFINDFIKFMCYNISCKLQLEPEEESELYEIYNKVFIEQDNKIYIDDNELDKLCEVQYKKFQNYIKKSTNISVYLNFKKRLSCSNDFEQYEHGIMSAFLLMKTIYAFSTVDFTYNDYTNIESTGFDFAKFISMQSILKAVSDHTCPKYQITSINDSSEFLVFIDELEEFSRISRANQSRQYVAEFCKTDLSFVDGWFQIDFIFDNENLENLDPEFAFKGRCRKFLTLFDICNMDDNLKVRVRCIDKVLDNNNIYCLEITKKYANIIINDEEQNIPKYLRSKIFYTKEEYTMQ